MRIIPLRKTKDGLAEMAGGMENVALARAAGAFGMPVGGQFQPWLAILPDSLIALLSLHIPATYFAGQGREELIQNVNTAIAESEEPLTKNPLVTRSMARTRNYREFRRLLASVGKRMPHTVEEALDLFLEWGLIQQYAQDDKLVIDYALPWPHPAEIFPSLKP